MQDMDPDQEAKRLKSIRYILRRRKRGRRVGANSGKVVKSWAEYSEVNFTPTGSYSTGWRRWIWVFVVPLAIFAPIIIIAATGNAHRAAEAEIPGFAWIVIGLLIAATVGVVAFAAAFTLLSLWRALRRLSGYKKE